nr:peptidase domain-containing ABC transporter [uncultured Porphyromonas sp.]
MKKNRLITSCATNGDSGLACLAMVATHYHITLPSSFFEQKVSSTLTTLAKHAESLGLRSIGGHISKEKLATQVQLPCIIPWSNGGFVLLEKVSKKWRKERTYHIIDPGNSREAYQSYDESDFLTYWGKGGIGAALLLEPSPLLQSPKVTKSKLAFLWSYLQRYRSLFIQIMLGLWVVALLQLLFPFLTQAVVDYGIGQRQISFVWLILIAQLMLVFSRTAIDLYRDVILLHIACRLNISLISDFFIKLMRLPIAFFDQRQLGDLLQRIEDNQRVQNFLTYSPISFLYSLFTFLLFSTVLALYQWGIFLVFIAGTVVYVVWKVLFLKKRKQLDYQLFEKECKNSNVTYQLINGMQEIKLQGWEQPKRWEWEHAQAGLFKVHLNSLNLQQTQAAGCTAIREISNVIITIISATAVINGDLTLGMMLAIQSIVGQLNSPVEQLIGFIYSWQDVCISLDRIQKIHHHGDEDSDTFFRTRGPIESDIHLSHLSFKYLPNSPRDTLHDISLTIPHGKVTAIVGPSGSGKTTLLKLLLGYYQVSCGEIKLGDKPLDQYSLEWWRAQCGVVMQDGYLFSDTVAKNIAPTNIQPDEKRLQEVIQLVGLSDWIAQLPHGINTIIGGEGQGVSEGQKQRILIARMLYKEPDILLLDEATSHLNKDRATQLIEQIYHQSGGKTIIVIAHQLATIQQADQIIYLSKGRIIEQGTHQQLMEKKGEYYRQALKEYNHEK